MAAGRETMCWNNQSVFGIGVGGSMTALVAFLKGKATPSESPRYAVLLKML
jgi:hypothetical protein